VRWTDGRRVRLRPVDGEGEARLEHDDGVRVGRVDALDQFLLFERDGAAVNGLLAVARDGALLPARVARRVVADDDDRHFAGARRAFDRAAVVALRVLDADVRPDLLAEPCERRDGVGRRAAVPVEQHVVGARADDGD
jgi:hypothetical protein